jgi:hypothetical protein
MRPKALAIKSVACEDNYYTFKSNLGVPADTPDQFYKAGENAAAPLIQRLLTSSKLELSSSECLVLGVFIGYLAQRTPMARDKSRNIQIAQFKQKLQHFARHKDEFIQAVVYEMKLVDSEATAEKYRQCYLSPDKHFNFDLNGEVDDFTIQQTLKAGEYLAGFLLKKHWTLVEPPAIEYFITSDNPFLVLAPKPYVRGMEVSPRNSDCLFPLSPRRALLFSNTFKHDGLYRFGKKRMASWLKQFIWFGYDRLFASFVCESIKEEFDKVPAGKIAEMPVWGLPKLPPLKKRV